MPSYIITTADGKRYRVDTDASQPVPTPPGYAPNPRVPELNPTPFESALQDNDPNRNDLNLLSSLAGATTTDSKAAALHQILQSVAKASADTPIPVGAILGESTGALNALAKIGSAIAGSGIGAMAGSGIASALGAGPGVSSLAGDVSGAATFKPSAEVIPSITSKAGTAIGNVASAVEDAPITKSVIGLISPRIKYVLQLIAKGKDAADAAAEAQKPPEQWEDFKPAPSAKSLGSGSSDRFAPPPEPNTWENFKTPPKPIFNPNNQQPNSWADFKPPPKPIFNPNNQPISPEVVRNKWADFKPAPKPVFNKTLKVTDPDPTQDLLNNIRNPQP